MPADAKQDIVIDVLVPAYNEEATILDLLRSVRRQKVDGFRFNIIVVDDGSKDSTPQLLNDNPDLYDEMIRRENGGKGAAVITGLQAAKGEYILFQDADLEYDPDEYADLVMPIAAHDADIVMGSRMLAPKITRVHYFWHKIGNNVITLAFNILNNTTFTDTYSCYLMYRRSLVTPHELETRGWEQHAEILSLASRRAKRIYEVPISYHGRSYEDGKKIRWHHALPVLWTILKMRLFRAAS
jgi:glycosyltransferase involved in cell wall biosynthesis